MAVRPQLSDDLDHARIEDGESGVEDGHAGIESSHALRYALVEGAHHLGQSFNRSGRRICLTLNSGAYLDESGLHGENSRFDACQPVAAVIAHQHPW